MQRLNSRSFFIFYFSALRKIFVLLLLSMPFVIILSIAAYSLSSLIERSYLFTRLLVLYTMLTVTFFSITPFIWGYLKFLLTTFEFDKNHIRIKKSIIPRRVNDISFAHVQSVTIDKEPLLEFLGLCSITFQISDEEYIRLSGLEVEKAHYIRSLYLESSTH